MYISKVISKSLAAAIFCVAPYTVSANSLTDELTRTFEIINESLESQNIPRHEIVALISRLEKLAKENQQITRENQKLTQDIDMLKTQYQHVKKELDFYKPQKLPKLTKADFDDKHFNMERIYKLRSAICFDPNGDASCLFQKVSIGDNKEGYLLYKANRIIDESLILGGVFNKEGEVVGILTEQDAKIIKKWEQENPELLLLMADY